MANVFLAKEFDKKIAIEILNDTIESLNLLPIKRIKSVHIFINSRIQEVEIND